MNKILFIVCVLMLFSCGSEKKETAVEESNPEDAPIDTLEELSKKKDEPRILQTLRPLIKRIETISLPLQFRLHEIDYTESLFEYDSRTAESKLLVDNQSNFVYGLLPDTSSYYGIITFISGDAMVPVLIIYGKKGNFISKETLVVRGCGADCGILKCTCDCLIDEKLNVTLVDTNHYYLCGDDGSEIKNSRKYFFEKKTFSLSSEGKIINLNKVKSNIKQ